MKSGTGSAIAFGRVLRAVRIRSSKHQADVADCFTPPLSVAAVSMAESGKRPPKTEAIVRTFAKGLELDDDALVDLWWAMQGMAPVEGWRQKNSDKRWWRELEPYPQAELEYHRARAMADQEWTPNGDIYAPAQELFTLAELICEILEILLSDSWEVRRTFELGQRDRICGRSATVVIELRDATSDARPKGKRLAWFACPEPVARPGAAVPTTRPAPGTIAPDLAWILASVEAMPARERAAVAGFIHGLSEGANLYSEVAPAPAS